MCVSISISVLFSHLATTVYLFSRSRLLNVLLNQPLVDRDGSEEPAQLSANNPIHSRGDELPKNHANLHHPPIRPRIHFQLVVPDPHLVRNHPPKQPNLEERQAQKVRFCSSHDRLGPVLPAHRRDAEVLEDDAEEQCEAVVDEQAWPHVGTVDHHARAVDKPFANEIAQNATCTAVGNADEDGRPHGPVGGRAVHIVHAMHVVAGVCVMCLRFCIRMVGVRHAAVCPVAGILYICVRFDILGLLLQSCGVVVLLGLAGSTVAEVDV